jgi:N-acetylglucosaminyldiphosphoundecaprenol N-acetyl-beta-D-mannosaminyltransferase
VRSSSLLTEVPRTSAPTFTVLGVEYFIGDLDSAAATVIERVRSSRGGYSCLCGVHGIVTAQHSPSLMGALREAWLNFPDGAPVAWLLRRMGAARARRVAGPDLMPRVIDAGQEAGLRHYLYGSTPEVLGRLEERLLERYPRAIIAGRMSPPFRELSDEEQDRIAGEISASGADVVWVGLGLPKQDEWLRRNAELIAPAVGLGVGAAFDFVSETKPRAPRWARDAGLEWLHRLVTEPRRLARRYAVTNTEFLARAGLAIAGRHGRAAIRRLGARTRAGEASR